MTEAEGLAESVKRLRPSAAGYWDAGCLVTFEDYPEMRQDIRNVLDALEEAEREHRPGCDEALREVQIERDKAEAALREAQETCHDRNHVGLRKFITGLGDVPSERGQDIAFLALKFEQALREAQEENETSARVIQDLNKAWDIRERQASERENQLRAALERVIVCGNSLRHYAQDHPSEGRVMMTKQWDSAIGNAVQFFPPYSGQTSQGPARAALSPIPATEIVLKSRG